MARDITKAEISPGVYIDLEQPDLITIDPKRILDRQQLPSDNMMESRIFETLRKQYVAIGYRVVLLTDAEAVDDDSVISEGED